MKTSRRKFIKNAGIAGITMAGYTIYDGLASSDLSAQSNPGILPEIDPIKPEESKISVIGQYGSWASSLNGDRIPSMSFRRKESVSLQKWQKDALARVKERMAIPDIGSAPGVTVKNQYVYDGLQIEELTWQLPYGRPTEAVLLKPVNATAPLPGILAFHDHGGNKYFGTRKITRIADSQHPVMIEHQKDAYSGKAWANEVAKRGYVVLVPDAFTFGSRRVMLQDVPEKLRGGLSDENPEDPANIEKYNQWAANHESVMAKSLFSAGTTWPGVFFAEDRIAVDILASRKDVDPGRIGCGGLSGGGLRTVMMGGLEPRIRCAVCVGFMTTWKDFLLNKSFTHTWMTYVPLLPNELDFPEILGLRVPKPALVLNDSEDDLYTLPEMNRAESILKEVYTKAGASDRFRCSYYPGGHKFDAAMQNEAFDWFDRWLK